MSNKYDWMIDSDTEMFNTESGPQKGIINSGESEIFVPLVEEKISNKVLSKTELIIEDYSGIYKVKNK